MKPSSLCEALSDEKNGTTSVQEIGNWYDCRGALRSAWRRSKREQCLIHTIYLFIVGALILTSGILTTYQKLPPLALMLWGGICLVFGFKRVWSLIDDDGLRVSDADLKLLRDVLALRQQIGKDIAYDSGILIQHAEVKLVQIAKSCITIEAEQGMVAGRRAQVATYDPVHNLFFNFRLVQRRWEPYFEKAKQELNEDAKATADAQALLAGKKS